MQVLERLRLRDLLEKREKEANVATILDILVGENGNNLSQGEKQLLCFARALVRKPKLLLLDEATANLDENTEQLVHAAILSELHDSTLIIVSHRATSFAICNKFLHITNGTCIELSLSEANALLTR